MVNITFKNVGQGDSILLEWNDGSLKKIGIIDCHIHQGSNPVLEHIKEKGYTEIEFLILTHPHLDHFSGFKELINTCLSRNITIKKFLHTAITSAPYLQAASKSMEVSDKLFELFDLLFDLMNKELIQIYSLDDDPSKVLKLNDEFKMEVLAPSTIEINKFIQSVNYPFDEEVSSANPNANWLSTVIKISNDYNCMILTSDVDKSVLTRIGNKSKGRIGHHKLLLAQAPHHGANGNLNKPFWQLRTRNEITPIIISVGKNNYRHPSKNLLDFFIKTPNYEIYRTDRNQIISTTEKANRINNLLDVVSIDQTDAQRGLSKGDVSFSIDGSEVIFQ